MAQDNNKNVSFDSEFRKLNQDWWIELAVQHTLATNELVSFEDNVRKLQAIVFMKRELEEEDSFDAKVDAYYQKLSESIPAQQAYVRALHYRFRMLMRLIGGKLPEDTEAVVGGEEAEAIMTARQVENQVAEGEVKA